MDAFNALPDMFVANIGNGCSTKEGSDLKFDNPGKSVEVISSSSLAGPVGSCASSGTSSSTSGSGASSTGAGTGTSDAGANAGANAGASAGTGSGQSDAGANAAGSGSKTEPSKDGSGGAFYTITSSAGAKQTATPQDQSPAGKVPEPKATSSSASDAKSANSPSKEGSPKSEGSSASTPGSAANGSPSAGASQKSVGSQCSNEGAWNCIDGKSYQQCASGTWSVVMRVAAGTTCNSTTADHMVIKAKAKLARRIPRAHLRRHINRMKLI